MRGYQALASGRHTTVSGGSNHYGAGRSHYDAPPSRGGPARLGGSHWGSQATFALALRAPAAGCNTHDIGSVPLDMRGDIGSFPLDQALASGRRTAVSGGSNHHGASRSHYAAPPRRGGPAIAAPPRRGGPAWLGGWDPMCSPRHWDSRATSAPVLRAPVQSDGPASSGPARSAGRCCRAPPAVRACGSYVCDIAAARALAAPRGARAAVPGASRPAASPGRSQPWWSEASKPEVCGSEP